MGKNFPLRVPEVRQVINTGSDAQFEAPSKDYFLFISFPQQLRGTVQLPFPPASQVQALVTCSSRPHVLHRKMSPFFISEQFAIEFPSFYQEKAL
jgi:hypothetical protein